MRIKQQRGMTFVGGLIALGSAAFILYSAVVMIFLHMDHLKVDSALEALKVVHHVTKLSDDEIRSKLRINLNNNNIYGDELDRLTKLFKIDVQNDGLKVNIEYSLTYDFIFGFKLTKFYKDKVSIPTH